MKNRPWPIVILAATQLFTPIVSIALSSWKLKTPFFMFFRLFLKYGTFWQLFELFGLSLIACVAIWAIKKWSYPVFLGIFTWGVIGNYLVWAKNPGVYSLGTLVAVNLVNLAVVSYFLIPAVRAAYFEPKLRWWESKPRFRVSIDADIKWDPAGSVSSKFQKATVCDLSEGGVFVRATERLDVGDTVVISFTIHHRMVSMRGQVVHQGKPESGGYGIQFAATSRDESRAIRDAVKGLELLGYERCTPELDLIEDFRVWTTTLLTTGEGFVPKVPERRVDSSPTKLRETAGKPPSDDADQDLPKAA